MLPMCTTYLQLLSAPKPPPHEARGLVKWRPGRYQRGRGRDRERESPCPNKTCSSNRQVFVHVVVARRLWPGAHTTEGLQASMDASAEIPRVNVRSQQKNLYLSKRLAGLKVQLSWRVGLYKARSTSRFGRF